ncbi:MAG TPA: M14 family zinc carboxypeptidase [Gaiellales bacterium]|nr:M14 family zinc carboxypeptidase [Gaiellales bacterium]
MLLVASRPVRMITVVGLALSGVASAGAAGIGTAALARRAPVVTGRVAGLNRTVVALGRRILLGRSVEGRPIVAFERGDPSSTRKVLVVGCTHGNECAGTAIAERLLGLRAPPRVDLWIIPDLNPDGAARGTRDNAHGVDLNRNFPWHWRRLYGLYDSGSRPLSEREARIAHTLILRLRPAVSIWFHQHLALVDESGGDTAIERRFANLAGLPLARLPREPGSITSWQNHTLAGTAFVVELPAGPLLRAATGRLARAVLTISGGSIGAGRPKIVANH